ncbi:hypothetical protein BH09SUM1_BH09SUM1_01870 [soil metagenome]
MESQTNPKPHGLPGHQPARLFLVTSPGATPEPYTAYVTRISPWGIRLALYSLPSATLKQLFDYNREAEVFLQLPRPLPSFTSKAAVTGIATNFNVEEPPMVFDLDFVDLGEKEEQALRDSNPQLVIS